MMSLSYLFESYQKRENRHRLIQANEKFVKIFLRSVSNLSIKMLAGTGEKLLPITILSICW